jgi:PPOX class probable F420-dependent enzyme
MPAAPIELSPRVQRHLESDVVIWLTTVGAGPKPRAVPVWFWWNGESFLIFSLPGQKVNDIEANPNVELHLNTDRSGDFVARFDGVAEILSGHPPANRVSKYIAKYRERVRGYGWTPKGFAEQYHIAIRVTPKKLRS